MTPFFYVKKNNRSAYLTEKLARGEILNQAAQSHWLHFPKAQKRRGMCVIILFDIHESVSFVFFNAILPSIFQLPYHSDYLLMIDYIPTSYSKDKPHNNRLVINGLTQSLKVPGSNPNVQQSTCSHP